ncbi:MAG TPA: hypothetical protein VK550_33855 [Polyangiaceae bacterium]|nr:hypothetical protein [Polyangiaceae bacterium]
MAMRTHVTQQLIALAALCGGAACSGGSTAAAPNPSLDGAAPDGRGDGNAFCEEDARLAGKCRTLSEYGLFAGTGATQEPLPGVFRYDVIAPLFADDAGKHRFIQMPEAGEKAHYREGEPWDLPVGSIVVKTFFYPRDARDPAAGERLLETRLLIRAPAEIVPITYVWNAAQTEAVREVAGRDVNVDWIDENGSSRATEYRIPNTNDCKRCHGLDDTHFLGVRTRQLDRRSDAFGGENQIDALVARGFFESPPALGARDHLVDPEDESAPIDLRGRSYLEANCGHCHNKSAAADWSGLELDWGDHFPGALGVCKSPSSAGDTGGHRFDVVPGKPEQSVLLYRMQLADSAYRMPEGSRTPDARGIAVIAGWITAFPPAGCMP